MFNRKSIDCIYEGRNILTQVGEHATRENIIYIAKEAEKEGINYVWVLDRLPSAEIRTRMYGYSICCDGIRIYGISLEHNMRFGLQHLFF